MNWMRWTLSALDLSISACTCGNEWNTFDTGRRQPCLHHWKETQCLSCSRWSPHSEWYAHS